MEAQRWLEGLADELRSRGLPHRYVERYVGELSDHLNDIECEEQVMSTEASIERKMGTPEQLTAAALTEYHRITFAGRHPWLTFVLAPVPTLALVVVVYLLILIGGASMLEGATVSSHPMTLRTFVWVSHGLAFVPATAVSLLLCVQRLEQVVRESYQMIIRQQRFWQLATASEHLGQELMLFLWREGLEGCQQLGGGF